MSIQLLITSIWFGLSIHETYLIRLSRVEYPVQILLNPPLIDGMPQYSKNILNADRYRLQYLKNGGVYADFDTIIVDYKGLMAKIQNFNGSIMMMDDDSWQWQSNINNNFIYVSPKNNSVLLEILQNQGKFCTKDTPITYCNGPAMFSKYRSKIGLQKLDNFLYHEFDYGWFVEAKTSSKKVPQKILEMREKKYEVKYMNGLVQEKISWLRGRQKVLSRYLSDIESQTEKLQRTLIQFKEKNINDSQLLQCDVHEKNRILLLVAIVLLTFIIDAFLFVVCISKRKINTPQLQLNNDLSI